MADYGEVGKRALGLLKDVEFTSVVMGIVEILVDVSFGGLETTINRVELVWDFVTKLTDLTRTGSNRSIKGTRERQSVSRPRCAQAAVRPH